MLEFNFLYFHIPLLHFLEHNNLRGFSLWHGAYECYKRVFTAKYPQELFTLLSALLRHLD